MPPAARITDMHTCPMVNPGPVPHVGGPISTGDPSVLIGMMPAARVGDVAVCTGPPDSIAKGSMSVLVGYKPTARIGDNTVHGGVIVAGCPSVLIGDLGGGPGTGGGGGAGGGPRVTPAGANAQVQTLIDAKRAGAPFCEICQGVPKSVLANPTPAPINTGPVSPVGSKPKVTTCCLKAFCLVCGHKERAFVFRTDEPDDLGRPMKVLELTAGFLKDDEIELSTELDRPYCAEHQKRAITSSSGQIKGLAAGGTKATGKLAAGCNSLIQDALNRNPFEVLWPAGIPPRVYTITAPTCGGSRTATLKVYPDLHWTVGLSIQLGSEYAVGLKKERSRGEPLARTELSGSRRYQTRQATLKMTYGRNTVDYAEQFNRYFELVLTAAHAASKLIEKSSRLLGTWCGAQFTITLPNVFVRGEWGWKEIPGKWQAGYELKVSAGFDPLIGLCLDVDIIAALLSVAGSPALGRLKKILNDSVAEVGVYLKAEGTVGGSASASRILGQTRINCEGEVSGSIEVSLEGRIKIEKKILLFTVAGEARAGGKTALNADLRSFADETGFGMAGNASWDPLTLYLVAMVSAGFEVDRDESVEIEACDSSGRSASAKAGSKGNQSGTGEMELADLSHPLWDTVPLITDRRIYFVKNADSAGGSAT